MSIQTSEYVQLLNITSKVNVPTTSTVSVGVSPYKRWIQIQ